jgi:hypothetical protein
MKFEPFAVSVKACPPRVAVFGEIAVRDGLGFCCEPIFPPQSALAMSIAITAARGTTRVHSFKIKSRISIVTSSL